MTTEYGEHDQPSQNGAVPGLSDPGLLIGDAGVRAEWNAAKELFTMPMEIATMLMRSWISPDLQVRFSRMLADELYAQYGDVPLLPWLRMDLALRGSVEGRAREDVKDVVQAARERSRTTAVPFLSRFQSSDGASDAQPAR